ncbi:MAG TPA: cytochrome c-type biogenesis CcmF C-terminal domain-containing protein, partial [Longimicrobiales bacterium]
VILLVVALLLALWAGARSPYALLAFAFAGFAYATNIQEFVQGANARRRAHGESFAVALLQLVRGNNRRYGGYIAHIGVITVALGVAGSSEFKIEKQATLRPGETMQVQGYTLRFDRTWGRQEPQRVVIGADVSVLDGDRVIGRMDPRMNFYGSRSEPVPTPSVRTRPNADLYLNLMSFERDGTSVTLTVFVEPLVGWIWIGGIVVALGAFIGLMKPRQRTVRRREVVEHESVPA